MACVDFVLVLFLLCACSFFRKTKNLVSIYNYILFYTYNKDEKLVYFCDFWIILVIELIVNGVYEQGHNSCVCAFYLSIHMVCCDIGCSIVLTLCLTLVYDKR